MGISADHKMQRKQNRMAILAGTFIACFIGFYNQYPLVYSDTGMYLYSGFEGEVPLDRTIFYGLFARHISLSASLWIVIITQGIFISWLLHMTFGIFFQNTRRNVFFLFTITFITLTTGFSHTVSMLLPDVFSAIALLCLVNLLFNPNLLRRQTIGLTLLFIFSLVTHLSNLPTFGLLLIFLTIGHFYRKRKGREPLIVFSKLRIPALALGLTLIIVPTTNYAVEKKFEYAGGSHVFMVNHLMEIGVLQQYLNHECDEENLKICAYKNELSWNFIWDNDSPLYKTGGWIANKKEYKRIIGDVYSSPKYWPLITQKTIEYTAKQFFTFDVTDHGKYTVGSAPLGQVELHYKDSAREYLSSKQNNNRLDVKTLSQIQLVVVLVSLVMAFMIAFFPLSIHIDNRLKTLIRLSLLYGLINSAVCANLATVDARFQNRWIWFIPVLVVITILQAASQYRKREV